MNIPKIIIDDPVLVKMLRTAAKDKKVQKSILSSMFCGSFKSTDVWESLEEDAGSFSKNIKLILFGKFHDDENYDGDGDSNCIYRYPLKSSISPHFIITVLIELVQENIIKKL